MTTVLGSLLASAPDQAWRDRITEYFADENANPIRNSYLDYLETRFDFVNDLFANRPMYQSFMGPIEVFDLLDGKTAHSEGLCKFALNFRAELVGKTLLHVSCENGLFALYCRWQGLHCNVVPGTFGSESGLCDGAFVANILNAIHNDMEFPLYHELDDEALAFLAPDVVLFEQVFWDEAPAVNNLALARVHARAGRRVIVCSNSLYEGTNPFVSLKPSEIPGVHGVWEIQGHRRTVFDLRAR